MLLIIEMTLVNDTHKIEKVKMIKMKIWYNDVESYELFFCGNIFLIKLVIKQYE